MRLGHYYGLKVVVSHGSAFRINWSSRVIVFYTLASGFEQEPAITMDDTVDLERHAGLKIPEAPIPKPQLGGTFDLVVSVVNSRLT